MSQSATYSIVLLPAAVGARALGRAGAAAASAARSSAKHLDRWLAKTAKELETMNLGAASIPGTLLAQPGALLPLYEQLGLDICSDARTLLHALEERPLSERATLVSRAVRTYCAGVASCIECSVTTTLSELGYQRRRSDATVTTYAHRDGTSVRVRTRARTTVATCEIELGGFNDGRCRNVRAAIEQGLRKQGVELGVIATDDLPLSTAATDTCSVPIRSLLR